jgi:putative transposase
VSPAAERRALGHRLSKGISGRLGCKSVGLSRNASRRERVERRPELRAEVLKLSRENPRYGFRRVHALLWPGVNLKAVHRIWREQGLALPTRKRRRVEVEKTPAVFGDCWSLEFASEWLENRRRARIAGLLDVATRETLFLKAQPSIGAHHVLKELSWLFLVHANQRKVRFDNGPEFRSRKLMRFFEEQGLEAGFIEPGSPWQNGHIESFFGKLRDELLNMEVFPTGADLQARLDEYHDHYNNRRPHSALGGLTPATSEEKIKIEMEAEALTPQVGQLSGTGRQLPIRSYPTNGKLRLPPPAYIGSAGSTDGKPTSSRGTSNCRH